MALPSNTKRIWNYIVTPVFDKCVGKDRDQYVEWLFHWILSNSPGDCFDRVRANSIDRLLDYFVRIKNLGQSEISRINQIHTTEIHELAVGV